LLNPTAAYATAFIEACIAGRVRGNLAFDAQIAAVCGEHGVDELLTADPDFARFSSLRIRALVD
jgi:predicted nucleic acid-binding protein